MTTTNTAGKPAQFAREYLMIVTRRRRLLGFGGLTELVLVGLWDDETGRRRRTELVRLGAASSVDSALRLAESGMERTEPGTPEHRAYQRWYDRLRAAERALVACEARYRERVRQYCTGLPEYAPELVAAE